MFPSSRRRGSPSDTDLSELDAVVHVVGAGLSGLSCAVRLAAAGRHVILYDAANQAGGRCRSYHDDHLDRQIDNGNHLILSGNTEAIGYLRLIGAEDRLSGPQNAEFPFVDLQSGQRWTFRPGGGVLPWWIFSPDRRIPDSVPWDYLRGVRLAFAGARDTVAGVLDRGDAFFDRFWNPFSVAVLNTASEEASARLLWPVIRETMGRGEAWMRPRIAKTGLSDALVTPAIAFLATHNCSFRTGFRLREVTFGHDHARSLLFSTGKVHLGSDDHLVLAVPPHICCQVLPGIPVPTESRAILNAHFRLKDVVDCPSFLGVLGGTAQWIFRRRDIASVTVSAADGLVTAPAEDIAERIWSDVAGALELVDRSRGSYRIVKEKRATFAQTPDQIARRPETTTAWRNILLAGDWTRTGLPATIEGAVRSGHSAAKELLNANSRHRDSH